MIYDSVEQFTDIFSLQGVQALHISKCSDGWLHFFCWFIVHNFEPGCAKKFPENMYDEQIEHLISAALADGVLTEKEKQILFKKAQSLGIDLDEFEMVLDARLVELAKAEKS